MAEYQPKQLDQREIDKLQQLEDELGATLVAYQPRVRVADLSPQQLEKVKELEQELSVILIAYEMPQQHAQ